MNLNKMSGRRTSALLASMLAGVSLLGAADEATPAAVPAAPASATTSGAQSQNDEIARLQAALAAQQKQLEALQKALEQQQKLLQSTIDAKATDSSAAKQPASLGTVASLTPVVPAPAPAPFALPTMATPAPQAPMASGGNPCETGPDANAVPPYLRLGNVCITPVGFMDLTAVWRDKNAAPASVPTSAAFRTTTPSTATSRNSASVRRTRASASAIDGDWKGAHFIGYNEFDFLAPAARTLSASPTAPSFRVSASSGWMSAKARSSSWPARAGAC